MKIHLLPYPQTFIKPTILTLTGGACTALAFTCRAANLNPVFESTMQDAAVACFFVAMIYVNRIARPLIHRQMSMAELHRQGEQELDELRDAALRV